MGAATAARPAVLTEAGKRNAVVKEAVQDKGSPVCLTVGIFHRLSVPGRRCLRTIKAESQLLT